jgi:radical SAM superfamily enzyme YgiQ (UPF0313 family)
MRVVLWDTRKLDVSKDFAGGMGIGMFPRGGGLRGKLVRYFYTRDRRPTSLLYAYLAAIFRRLGHTVEYAEDRFVAGADLYVFNPSLITLAMERQTIVRLLDQQPGTRVLVVGTVASVLPQAFQLPGVTVVKGEAEQLLWKLDAVLARPGATVQLGSIEDLDRLPFPDWSPFAPRQFRIAYDFWKFPTGLIQAGRGCTMKCNYCPYIVLENSNRLRDPQAVVDEMEQGIGRWGFRSFKFRDPLFGLDRAHVFRLAELIHRMPHKIQFSVESRIELMRPEVLRVLHRAGLTSITVGIETPAEETLRQYHRVPIRDDRQREFVALCRSMGIRTVAGFLLGFPHDTRQSIRDVGHYACTVGPTYANFNVVTPYPGTEFAEQIKDQIADFDYSRYTTFTPVLKYEHLTAEQVAELHHWCARRFYFRWEYLRQNAHLLWPWLQKLGLGRERSGAGGDKETPTGPHHAVQDTLSPKGLRQDKPHQS